MQEQKKKTKWLIINTEAFSPKGAGKKDKLTFADLPWVIQRFLSVFPKPFIVLDESSKIKSNDAMREKKKSTRNRLIRLLNKFGHRCVMTGTFISKSPVNAWDQMDFLREGYFPESMWEFAERYCIMTTLKVARGRRVLISQKDWERIRTWMKRSYIRDGINGLKVAIASISYDYNISHAKVRHILVHKKYTPFIDVDGLMGRIAPDVIRVKREDIMDIAFEKFVREPIKRPVKISTHGKKIANELIDIGFTDKMVLGKVPALELTARLQDICNGFEPISTDLGNGKRKITHQAFKENPKIDELMELLEEIDVGCNQIVIWCSRKLLIRACAIALTGAGISNVVYDGDASDKEKEEAERLFENQEVQVFIANQASGAYGLNCLGNCSYTVWMCIDGSVEKYHQSQFRILRGELKAPKFGYAIYAEGTVEERQWETLRVGKELIGAKNRREIFEFV